MPKLKRFPDKDIELNTRMYDVYIHSYHMDNGWHPGNQEYNFRALLRLADMTGVPIEGKDILDVGCGTGDFSKLLRRKKINHYVGIDIYKPFLQRARKAYPQEVFIDGDLLSDVITESFDYAFCSGALTIKLSVDNYEFLEAMIRKMWELTRIGLAFNILTDDDTDPDHDLFFYNPGKVRDICLAIDPDAKIVIEKTPRISQVHVYMYRPGDKQKTKNLLQRVFSHWTLDIGHWTLDIN